MLLALLGLTSLGNLYDKLALKRACLGMPDFGLFLMYFKEILSSKQVVFLSNAAKMTTVIIVFHMRSIGATEYHFGDINTSG